MVKDDQMMMFDPGKDWQNEWQDMPEFNQKDLSPYRTIAVHFEKKEDVAEFAKLVNQQITETTRSIWYPEPIDSKPFMNKRCIDDTDDKNES